MTPGSGPTDFELAVEQVVLELSRGEVVSYGWVAAAAGFPGRARGVGTFLARGFGGPNWWRVVAADGHLRAPNPRDQARRLRAEGVRVEDGRVRSGVKRP